MEYKQYFRYPISTDMLIAKKRRIKRALREELTAPVKKKIAILGGSTTNEMADQLELFLLFYGIDAEFYQSEYGQYWQDAMFGTPELDAFQPDIIYIHTNWRNIDQFPAITDTEQAVEDKISAVCNHFQSAWTALSAKFNCPIIQNNFERPNYRLMGNRDIWDHRGRSNYISRLNQFFYRFAAENKDFYINDIDFLAADFGLSQWTDAFCWHMYKYAMNINAIPLLANSVANIIKALYGKNKKALVLDLDNTLWGGVIGDDGQEGIAIGPEVPEGQVYAEFQSYCKALKSLGVILAVNSKNEEENARLGLMHPDGILRPEDFVAIKANWKPKDENIRQLALELNLGADSFVFADDNPAEREIVEMQVPGVDVPALTSVDRYIEVIDHGGFFETTTLSEEDLKKTELYRANSQRIQEVQAFASYEEYLDSLQMQATIKSFDAISISRIAQLTNKSNQFNLTTLRCNEDEIRAMQTQNDSWVTLQGRLEDKFGDNGIVSVVAGEILDSELHMRLWLMSCRVLKRGMEDAMMEKVIEVAQQRGIRRIFGYYYPTAKNAMVQNFYLAYGFRCTHSTESGNSVWELEVDAYTHKNLHITVK